MDKLIPVVLVLLIIGIPAVRLFIWGLEWKQLRDASPAPTDVAGPGYPIQ